MVLEVKYMLKNHIQTNAVFFLLGINRLLNNGTYEAAFPPHEVSSLVLYLYLYFDKSLH